jgi:hypothetical protein
MNTFFAQGYSPTYKIPAFIPDRYIDEWKAHKDHLTWWKSLHENSLLFRELAGSPDIIDVIAPILGTDKIQLWGHCRNWTTKYRAKPSKYYCGKSHTSAQY